MGGTIKGQSQLSCLLRSTDSFGYVIQNFMNSYNNEANRNLNESNRADYVLRRWTDSPFIWNGIQSEP